MMPRQKVKKKKKKEFVHFLFCTLDSAHLSLWEMHYVPACVLLTRK